jgi:SAM-dependent methyltransferase
MPNKLLERLVNLRFRGVDRNISENDLMYRASGTWYMHFGNAALDCILRAMNKAGMPDPENILVLPCGHGRELRFFRSRFPDARIVACDIDRDAVDFCARTFGVEGAYSHNDPGQISMPHRFDAIWCGSLVTHLDEAGWRALLQFFSEHLKSGGLLVFSTHGPFMTEKFRSGAYDLGIDEVTKKEMLCRYDQTGFAYGDYYGQTGYGISLSSKEWVRRLISEVPGLRLLDYAERGWFRNHDTVTCTSAERQGVCQR